MVDIIDTDSRTTSRSAFYSIVRESLSLAGWQQERVDDLFASGALDTPEIKAMLDAELLGAFEEAVRGVEVSQD